MATFQNNKKKDWFSHDTALIFIIHDVFKDRSRNSATFKMELFAKIRNDSVYNQWLVVFACCCNNLTIFTGKIKIGWKWSCYLQTCFYIFSKIRQVFPFFRKRQLLSASLTFCFISKTISKNENWYHCRFHLPEFY